jgi:hypothetical protein
VTPRRRRQPWARHHETVPHQSTQPTPRPTVRWVCHRRDGMHRVRLTRDRTVHDRIDGLGAVQAHILRLFGDEVCQLDHISPREALLNVSRI